jgi:peptide-methionine (S)-S-oxide reductase
MNENNSLKFETITLGGGCFWCTEAVFDRVRGITDVESGYTNGHTLNPSYEQICQGDTGHAEVVRLTFDADEISLQEILEIFFHTHDPTTLNRQGNDVGTQYRSGIYFENPEHGDIASGMIRQMSQDKLFGAPITTEVQPLANYSAAEAYHQDNLRTTPTQVIARWSWGRRWRSFARTLRAI